jgi:hypothetical protein
VNKNRRSTGIAKLTLLSASVAAALSACGGGGGDSPTSSGNNGQSSTSTSPTTTQPSTPATTTTGSNSQPSTPAATSTGSNTQPATSSAQLTGKAIDGYLAGATVCFDNGAGACDTSLPTTTTDSAGNYALPISGDVTGKQIDVIVTSRVTDVSNNNATFPATFVMSAVVEGSTQNVTPLTSMIVAQMQTGLSKTQAKNAVQSFAGNGIDLNADYIAGGDNTTAALAKQLVNTMMQFATDNAIDPNTSRNILNATVAKGNPAAVTSADVNAQASLPVYKAANASQILATPVVSFVSSDVTTDLANPIQAVRQIVDGALQVSYQQLATGTSNWADIPAGAQYSYKEPMAEFVMKSDGTWSDMITPATWHQPRPLTAIGAVLTGTDPSTGISFTYEERQVDLSGQSMATAVAGETFGPETSIYPMLTSPFPSSTKGYLGLQSYSADRVILPMGFSAACDFPFVAGDVCPTGNSGVNLPPYTDYGRNPTGSAPHYNPNQPINDPNLPVLTSIQQIVGRTVTEPVIMGADIQILANGKATITVSGWEGPRTIVAGTWSVYPRNPNVLVFDMSKTDATTVGNIGYNAWAIGQGAKLIMALRNGQLHSGFLFPAGYTEKSVQFVGKLPSVLTPKM